MIIKIFKSFVLEVGHVRAWISKGGLGVPSNLPNPRIRENLLEEALKQKKTKSPNISLRARIPLTSISIKPSHIDLLTFIPSTQQHNTNPKCPTSTVHPQSKPSNPNAQDE
jgi:hypothetical protein